MLLDQATLEIRRRAYAAQALLDRLKQFILANYVPDPKARKPRRELQLEIAEAMGFTPREPRVEALVSRTLKELGFRPGAHQGKWVWRATKKEVHE